MKDKGGSGNRIVVNARRKKNVEYNGVTYDEINPWAVEVPGRRFDPIKKLPKMVFPRQYPTGSSVYGHPTTTFTSIPPKAKAFVKRFKK